MPRVALDPILFSLPPKSSSRKQITDFVERLLDWKSVRSNNRVNACISQRSLSVLAESELYPNYSALSTLFRDAGIHEYSPNDILAIINEFLSRLPSLEQFIDIDDVSWSKINVQPDIASERPHLVFANELVRLLAVLASSLQCMDNRTTDHILGTTCSHTTSVHVEGTIDLIQLTNSNISIKAPFDISQDVPIATGFKSFLISLDEIELWMLARNEEDVIHVLQVAWFKEQTRAGGEPKWDSPPPFYVGASFLHTARQCGFNNDQGKITKLLSRMVDILLGRNLDKCHPLREDSGGGSLHLMQDGKCAMRWDITYDYHLHCWRLNNGTYEFVTVVTHNDFTI